MKISGLLLIPLALPPLHDVADEVAGVGNAPQVEQTAQARDRREAHMAKRFLLVELKYGFREDAEVLRMHRVNNKPLPLWPML